MPKLQKELHQILALQKSNENKAATIYKVLSNSAIDGYDIKKTTFDDSLISLVGEKRILVPETELFNFSREYLLKTEQVDSKFYICLHV